MKSSGPNGWWWTGDLNDIGQEAHTNPLSFLSGHLVLTILPSPPKSTELLTWLDLVVLVVDESGTETLVTFWTERSLKHW